MLIPDTYCSGMSQLLGLSGTQAKASNVCLALSTQCDWPLAEQLRQVTCGGHSPCVLYSSPHRVFQRCCGTCSRSPHACSQQLQARFLQMPLVTVPMSQTLGWRRTPRAYLFLPGTQGGNVPCRPGFPFTGRVVDSILASEPTVVWAPYGAVGGLAYWSSFLAYSSVQRLRAWLQTLLFPKFSQGGPCTAGQTDAGLPPAFCSVVCLMAS